jgi:SAM-dependent methyltransferase
MWIDVVDLKAFYATPLGQTAQRMVARRVRDIWPDVHAQTILGLGFAPPVLGQFLEEADRVVALMPAAQGVCHWPEDGLCLSALSHEAGMPFPDRFFDRIIMVHAFESADNTGPMIREIWRVLADNGRLLVVVPNRRGLWSFFERTPFGFGKPYSHNQLRKRLRGALFEPTKGHFALYAPPVRSRMILSAAPACEKIGERWFTNLGGVVLFEATKQIYAGVGSSEANFAYAPVPG